MITRKLSVDLYEKVSMHQDALDALRRFLHNRNPKSLALNQLDLAITALDMATDVLYDEGEMGLPPGVPNAVEPIKCDCY